MKFKVGDTVRVLPDVLMGPYVDDRTGQIGTILTVLTEENRLYDYAVKFSDRRTVLFERNELEKVDLPEIVALRTAIALLEAEIERIQRGK